MTWTRPAMAGTGPSPSVGHRLLALDHVPRTFLCLAGGATTTMSPRRLVLFLLHLEDQMWTRLAPTPTLRALDVVSPPPCQWSSHVFQCARSVYVFATSTLSVGHVGTGQPRAVYRFDLDRRVWTRQRLRRDCPVIRYNLSAIESTPEARVSYHVFGCDPDTTQCVDPLYCFSLDSA